MKDCPENRKIITRRPDFTSVRIVRKCGRMLTKILIVFTEFILIIAALLFMLSRLMGWYGPEYECYDLQVCPEGINYGGQIVDQRMCLVHDGRWMPEDKRCIFDARVHSCESKGFPFWDPEKQECVKENPDAALLQKMEEERKKEQERLMNSLFEGKEPE